MTELSDWDRDSMDHKAGNIYNQALYRKCLLTLLGIIKMSCCCYTFHCAQPCERKTGTTLWKKTCNSQWACGKYVHHYALGRWKLKSQLLSLLAHTCSLCSLEAKAKGEWIWGQPRLHSFYLVISCLKKTEKHLHNKRTKMITKHGVVHL